MKVILLRDVPKIGKKGDIKDVADGFAYNSLIPRKLAAPATTENVRRSESEKTALKHAREVKVAMLREVAEKSKETPVKILVPANAQGHLFKGLHAEDIASAIRQQCGVQIATEDIHLPGPLKEVGPRAVTLQFGDYRGECAILIEPVTK